MSWKIGVLVASALVVPFPRALAPEAAAAPIVAPAPVAAPERPKPARTMTPVETWSSSLDARALTADATHVWIATGGGVERYAQATRERRHFGVADGLDTLDVRAIESTPAGIVARTATGRCTLAAERFTCAPAKAPPPAIEGGAPFRGRPVHARIRVGADTWIATRGGGAFVAPGGDETKAVALDGTTNAPSSFVHTGAVFAGALWLGTFDDGLYRAPLDRAGELSAPLAKAARPAPSPARMINRVLATSGKDAALFVGASEGAFVSRDGVTFARVPAIGAHAITGLAATDEHLWVTSTEALYRLARDGRGPVQRSFVRPAGSHAIQSVAVDDHGSAWLATEDRGVVRVDADGTVRTFDRVGGLPSSWFVAVATDGDGGAVAATLRHGAVHIARDGTWKTIAWTPNAWGLGVVRDMSRTCVTTQGGASCETKAGEVEGFGLLPDPRVHMALGVGRLTIVGTEAGTAIYASR